MIFIILALWIENPRILKDTAQIRNNNIPISEERGIKIHGEKVFYSDGFGTSADIFQYTHILLSGKTKNGWEVRGILFDDMTKTTHDIYTVNLKDASTMYLIFKKKRDSFQFGRFSLFSQDINGAYMGLNYKNLYLKGGIGKKRAESGEFETNVSPPYDHPIRIRLKNGKIPEIVANTEQVFIDGKILDKRFYVMDYNNASLKLKLHDTFPYHNLFVKFEYHSVLEPAYVYHADAVLKTPFFKIDGEVYTEDIKQQFFPDSMGGVFLPHGGGDYEKNDSFFVYVGKNQGHYRVFFSLDTINGAYQYVDTGNFYVYVGRDNGKYSPIKENKKEPLLNYAKLNARTGSNLFTDITVQGSLLKNTLNSDTAVGITLKSGFNNKKMHIIAEIIRTKGWVVLPYTRFDNVKNIYTNSIISKEHLQAGYSTMDHGISIQIVHDSVLSFQGKAYLKNLEITTRGDSFIKETNLMCLLNPIRFYAFHRYRDTNGIFIGFKRPHIPEIILLFRRNSNIFNWTFYIHHRENIPSGNIEMQITKQKGLLTYSASSHIYREKFNASMLFSRTLAFSDSYILRYVRSESGNYVYDSTYNGMIPSQFGYFERIITIQPGDNTAYKDAVKIGLSGRQPLFSFDIAFQGEKSSSKKTMEGGLYIFTDELSGSDINILYHRELLSTDQKDNLEISDFNINSAIFRQKKVHCEGFAGAKTDKFSRTEDKRMGISFVLNNKNLKTKSSVARETRTQIKAPFFRFSQSLSLSKKDFIFAIGGSYTTQSSNLYPFMRFVRVNIQKVFPIYGTRNRIEAYLVISNNIPPRWGLKSALLF